MKKLLQRVLVTGASALVLATTVVPAYAASPADAPERSVEPVILTGAHLPGWSGAAAEGVPEPYPSGALIGERDAHNGHLVVSVSDDGVGGASEAVGSGLRGLADRAAAHGGTLQIESRPGEGTTLRAQLPCGL